MPQDESSPQGVRLPVVYVLGISSIFKMHLQRVFDMAAVWFRRCHVPFEVRRIPQGVEDPDCCMAVGNRVALFKVLKRVGLVARHSLEVYVTTFACLRNSVCSEITLSDRYYSARTATPSERTDSSRVRLYLERGARITHSVFQQVRYFGIRFNRVFLIAPSGHRCDVTPARGHR